MMRGCLRASKKMPTQVGEERTAPAFLRQFFRLVAGIRCIRFKGWWATPISARLPGPPSCGKENRENYAKSQRGKRPPRSGGHADAYAGQRKCIAETGGFRKPCRRIRGSRGPLLPCGARGSTPLRACSHYGPFALCLRQKAFLFQSSTVRVHSFHKKAFFLGGEQNGS